MVGFTPSGNGVWSSLLIGSIGQPERVRVTQWAIVRDNGTNTIKLEYLEETTKPLSDLQYYSSGGYQITNDGWILGSSGKLLLWLPHKWRSDEYNRKWGGGMSCSTMQDHGRACHSRTRGVTHYQHPPPSHTNISFLPSTIHCSTTVAMHSTQCVLLPMSDL